jgi:hypothetical protein
VLHKHHLILCALVAALANAAPVVSQTKQGPSIKKCLDAAGRWHYGDRAAQECAKSEIEVLNKEGLTKETIAAPPTEAELAEREKRKDEIEREQRAAEDSAKRDKILLSTYAHEDDIVLVRDRKLAQIEAQIKASEDTLNSLRKALERMEAQKHNEQEKNDAKGLVQTEKGIAQTKAQIERHAASVAQRRQEQEHLRQQYTEELQRYRELKKQPQARPAAKQ